MRGSVIEWRGPEERARIRSLHSGFFGKLRAQIEPDARLVSQDDGDVPSGGFHHLQRVVYSPDHDMLSSLCGVPSEALAFGVCENVEEHAEDLAGIPKEFACNLEGDTDMRQGEIGEVRLCRGDEARVPEAEQDSGCKGRLPVILSRDDFVHELEQPIGVILNLDIDVELDMPVLWSHEKLYSLHKRGDGLLGFLCGPAVLHTVIAIPVALTDEARRVCRAREVGIMEHNDHTIE